MGRYLKLEHLEVEFDNSTSTWTLGSKSTRLEIDRMMDDTCSRY